MSVTLKNISFTLDPSSITKAIHQISEFKKQLSRYCDELIKALIEEGIQVAKLQVLQMDAIDTGQLESSIQGVFFPEERMGVIFTDTPYAIYVEYGTGVVGESFKHPEFEEIGWEYDSHHHGDKGWLYLNEHDGQVHWTKGMISRPFMYNTLQWLRYNAPDIAVRTLSKGG